jgi:carotenoid cleavage dioxygenase-like enzyme
MSLATYHAGLETLDQEVISANLAIQGNLPSWLTGMLLRTGPAKFEVGGQPYRHWFDGLAMLHQFRFAENQIAYTNRFLQSGSFLEATEAGHIVRSEFATHPKRSLLTELLTLFSDRPLTDNGNVTVTAIGGQIVAATETPVPIAFDPDTLQTLNHFEYADELAGQTTTAHPHFDFEHNQIISYQIQFGRSSTYDIYTQEADSRHRSLKAQVATQQPAYMHSFPVSENYIVLVECPLKVNPLRLATTRFHRTPFIENYRWQPEQGTRFHIVDKASGDLINTCEGEPFFAFHYVNAFEQDNALVIDASSYADASIIEDFYLKNLRSATAEVHQGQLTRYRVPLQGDTVQAAAIANVAAEFPRIHYRRYNGKPYRFVYGGNSQRPSSFIDQLVKVDVTTGEVSRWQQPHCYPTEPIFVAAPEAVAEDDGVILSLVLDADQKQSFLLILAAQSFEEIARAEVPHAVPFGLHGQFFEDPVAPMGDRHFHR